MSELTPSEYINNIGEYMKTTGASGLLLHTSEEESPYSDYDFYIVFRRQRERIGFVQRGKEHVQNIGNVMPARLVLNWINPYGGVNSIFDVGGEVIKIDIGCETMKSVQRSSGILNSRIVKDSI